MTRSAAFNRTLLLSPLMLRQSLPVLGDVGAFATKLASGRPVTISAIGSSNVVRGGCQSWQNRTTFGGKCSHAKYTNRSADDGTAQGWLLQGFEALNATWPHPQHVLVNRALMATGPSGFSGCLGKFVPERADVVLLGFADMCRRPTDVDDHNALTNSTFGRDLERIVRALAARSDPPTLVFWNFFKWNDFSCSKCSWRQTCEGELHELAAMYGASTISLRNAFYTLGTTAHGGSKRSRFNYLAWTQDNGGHLSPSLGNKYAAELFFHWVRRVAERSPAPSADAPSLPTSWYHLPVGGVRGGA